MSWIYPVEYKVLIKPEKVEDKSAGGIYLPESAREREEYATDRGTILAVGDGFFSELPGPVPEVGDIVLFSKYAGSLFDIDVEGKRTRVRLMNDKDICAILREEKSNG